MRTIVILSTSAVLALAGATACTKKEKAPPPGPGRLVAADAAPQAPEAGGPGAAQTSPPPPDAATAGPPPATPPPAEPLDRTPVCTHEPYPVAPGMLEAGVLLDSSVVADRGSVTGFRIRQDGRVESRRPDGSWLAGKTLSGMEMEDVRRAIVQARLDGVAGTHRLPSPPPGVAEKRLLVRHGEETLGVFTDEPCFLPEVHSLMVLLAELVD